MSVPQQYQPINTRMDTLNRMGMSPALYPDLSKQDLLDQDIKEIGPDGTMKFHPTSPKAPAPQTPGMQQAPQPIQPGQPMQPTMMSPQPIQPMAAPGQAPTPQQPLNVRPLPNWMVDWMPQGMEDVMQTGAFNVGQGFDWMGSPQGQLMMGALASGIGQQGSWQHNIGSMAMQHAQNQMFNQLMQGSMMGGQSPFVTSSQTLGPQGVGGLTPDMQMAVIQSMNQQQMQPYQQGLMGSQIIKNLRPPQQRQLAPSNFVRSIENVDEQGNQTSARDKRIWWVDPKDPSQRKYGGYYTTPFAEGAGGDKTKAITTSDIESYLVDEFHEMAIMNIKEKFPEITDVAQLMEVLTDKQGKITASRTKKWLKPEQRKNWIKRRADYGRAPSFSAAADIYEKAFGGKVSEEQQYTNVASEEEALQQPLNIPYKTLKGQILVNKIVDGKKIIQPLK